MEETSDPNTGWSRLVAAPDRPGACSAVFKVAHHGSRNADCEGVWSDMLIGNPYALATPFSRGSVGLPTADDVQRICSYTDRAYISAAKQRPNSKYKRPKSVAKKIRTVASGRLQMAALPMGHIRLRNGGNDEPETWNTELFRGAMRLDGLYAPNAV